MMTETQLAVARTYDARRRYEEACERARAQSAQLGCTCHVTAVIETASHDNITPHFIRAYTVTDWYDGASVATYSNGRLI